MKIVNKILKRIIGLSALFAFILTSCKDDLPRALDSSDKLTTLESIRLVGVGADKNVELQGVINHDKKEISFPRIDPETDFHDLRFEIQASSGAKLEKDAYEVVFQEGESERTIVLKVVNTPRTNEYFAKLRLKVPVFGADFGRAITYDYSNNPAGNPKYASFTGGLVRGTGFSGEYVLVVDRNPATDANVHVLKVSDLKNNIISPIKLVHPTGGITGGTFVAHSGAIVNGHIYVASLSGGNTSPLKIYHWTDPTKPADVILNTTTAAFTPASYRFGDNMSINLDNSGNGDIYFIDNGGLRILKYKVTGYTTISDPTFFLTNLASVGSWGSFNKVPSSNQYIFTGHDAVVRLVGEQANVIYAATKYPTRLSDVRVVEFNGERYIMGVTAARTGQEGTAFQVYDVTRGSTIEEALRILDASSDGPLLSYSLDGPVNINPASQTGWHVVKDSEGKDEKLLIYVSTLDAGFTFFELPKKVASDD
ncbi:DUF4623 domain-containing protein [Sphingobacterium tabacisoli]|uniref:DUF4623 domain-containing protein n=1 Tax=Sphingobacterium tabacisoli TaxID=2044855 RepID=A0ABW5KXD3_9SPHI|nr:DUF4623 domain-containing protein [Sphingobacterium tabacisoli]